MARWVSTRDLLRSPGVLFEVKTPSLKVPKAASVSHEPETASAPPPPAKEQSTWAGKMSEIPHHEPSLASRVRPDLGSAADRHNGFHEAYHAKGSKVNTSDRHKKIRHLRGSSNVVLGGHLESGHGFIAKPHSGAAWGYEKSPDGGDIPDDDREAMHTGAESHEWHRRHSAVFDTMAAMGAHHMVPVGFKTKLHDHLKDTLASDENDSRAKAMRMPSFHAGQDAHVQEHVGEHTKASVTAPSDLAKVDNEDRLHGIVMHTLFGHTDGHDDNILVSKHGHSIAIDHDSSMRSAHSRQEANLRGGDSVVSGYAPGGVLDYRANRSDDVGMNYPHRMKEVLSSIAKGHHMIGDGAMDISKEDGEFIQERAKMMLEHGLEGTISQLKVSHQVD